VKTVEGFWSVLYPASFTPWIIYWVLNWFVGVFLLLFIAVFFFGLDVFIERSGFLGCLTLL
jgi:hypothetical protein